MSTTPLTDAITALTAYANEVTGASDTTLSDAVYTLAQGFGASGNIEYASGIAYLDADSRSIEVEYSLGGKADFAFIAMDYDNASEVPYGSCVMCAFGRLWYANMQNIEEKYATRFIYMYRHATSGNFLPGQSQQTDLSSNTSTFFRFDRGVYDWASTDANGNPVPYRWMVGRFTDRT